MTVAISQVDAFTSRPFAGNPAAVCVLPEEREEAWMQSVAQEMNLAETAFLNRRPDGWGLRWFTPTVEVDLCGHATLATAHVLWETNRLAADAAAVFHTRGGELRAERQADGAIELDFPSAPPEPCDAPAGLLDALGLDGGEMFRTTGEFFMVVVPDATIVRKLKPDFAAMRALPDVRGAYVTAPGDDGVHDIVSRCFGPGVGIDEDPVTGSMHCVLSAFWCERLGVDELRAEQASARGGTMRVRLAGDRTLLAGSAVTVLAGDLRV